LDIGKNADHKNREHLGEFLIRRYPNKAKQIYKELDDRGSLRIVLTDSLQKLNNFKETVIW